MRARLSLAWLLFFAPLGTDGASAWAQSADPLNDCKIAHLGCINACDSLEKDDAARTGCQTRCAADRGICEAERGFSGLTDQADRLKGFLEGLTQDPGQAPVECDTLDQICRSTCRDRHTDEATQSGCASRCAAEVALCRAQTDLRSAAPHLKENVDRWNRFMEGFRERKGGFELPETPSPAERKPGEISI